jgi:regulator of sirC expression with transglutaminase-like and TPR domain
MAWSARERFTEFAAREDVDIPLAEAALVIAQERYPDLDVEGWLGRLDAMAEAFRRRLRPDIPYRETVLLLNRYVFDELGFSGNSGDYYDPRNSYLNDVLDRRLGIPITLAIVYMEIGRRAGLRLEGVAFPGHFLVKCVVRDGTLVLDPFHRGNSLSIEDLRGRLALMNGGEAPPAAVMPVLLAAAGNREILVRILRNLKAIHLQREQFGDALAAADRIVALAPHASAEIRDRGLIYQALECFRPAAADFERYLALAPEADDVVEIRARIVDVHRAAARLN